MVLFKVVFWEEFVDCVEDEKTYRFMNLRVKEDNHTQEKFVNTEKEGCKMEATTPFTQPLPDIQISLSELTTKEVTIFVIGLKTLSHFYCCDTCFKKLEETDTPKYYCQPCNMNQKPKDEHSQWYCKIRVEDSTSQKYNLSVFHPELIKLVEMQGKGLLSTLSKDQLEDVFLDVTEMPTIVNFQQGKLVQVLDNTNEQINE